MLFKRFGSVEFSKWNGTIEIILTTLHLCLASISSHFAEHSFGALLILSSFLKLACHIKFFRLHEAGIELNTNSLSTNPNLFRCVFVDVRACVHVTKAWVITSFLYIYIYVFWSRFSIHRCTFFGASRLEAKRKLNLRGSSVYPIQNEAIECVYMIF